MPILILPGKMSSWIITFVPNNKTSNAPKWKFYETEYSGHIGKKRKSIVPPPTIKFEVTVTVKILGCTKPIFFILSRKVSMANILWLHT